MSCIAGLERFVTKMLTPDGTLGLEGNHGIGKTTFVEVNMVRCIAEKHKVPLSRVHLISRCAGQIDPADLGGGFKTYKGRTYNCPPNWLPTSKKYDDKMRAIFGDEYQSDTIYEDYYILFIDEWKRGNPLIHNALMEITLSHKIFGVDLHENTYIVVADNDDLDIYNGNANIDPAQMSRVENHKYAPTNEEYLNIFKAKTDAGKMHPVVLEFLMTYPEYIVISTETIRECAAKQQKTASPRDWEKLGWRLQNAANNNFDYVELQESDPVISGELSDIATSIVGVHGAPFVTYCNDRKGMSVNLDTIIYGKVEAERKIELKKLEEIKKLSIPVIAYTGARKIAENKLKKPEHGAHLLELLQALPNEGVAAFFYEWKAKDEKSAIDWMGYSGARMNVIYKTLGGYKKWCETMKSRGIDINSDEPIDGE